MKGNIMEFEDERNDMSFEQAKIMLNAATRWELRDHAFGDCEFGWDDGHGSAIAEGYSGGGKISVWFNLPDGHYGRFEGDMARELKQCGTLKSVERNDETGPEQYVEGYIMPGLTKEAVLKEITTPAKGTS
jgi:hypothetical protein